MFNNCEKQVPVFISEPEGVNSAECNDKFLTLKREGEKYFGFTGNKLCRKQYTRKRKANEPYSWVSLRKTSDHLATDFNYIFARDETKPDNIVLHISLKKEICCKENVCTSDSQIPVTFLENDFILFINALYVLLENEYTLQDNVVTQLSNLFAANYNQLPFTTEIKNDIQTHLEIMSNPRKKEITTTLIYIKKMIKKNTVNQLLTLFSSNIPYARTSFQGFTYVSEPLPISINIMDNGNITESSEKKRIKIFAHYNELGFERTSISTIFWKEKIETDPIYSIILISEFVISQTKTLYGVTFVKKYTFQPYKDRPNYCGYLSIQEKQLVFNHSNVEYINYIVVNEQLLKILIILAKVFNKKICFLSHGQFSSNLITQ